MRHHPVWSNPLETSVYSYGKGGEYILLVKNDMFDRVRYFHQAFYWRLYETCKVFVFKTCRFNFGRESEYKAKEIWHVILLTWVSCVDTFLQNVNKYFRFVVIYFDVDGRYLYCVNNALKMDRVFAGNFGEFCGNSCGVLFWVVELRVDTSHIRR